MILKLLVLLVIWIAIIRFAVPTRIGKIILSIPFVVLIIMAYVIHFGEIK